MRPHQMTIDGWLRKRLMVSSAFASQRSRSPGWRFQFWVEVQKSFQTMRPYSSASSKKTFSVFWPHQFRIMVRFASRSMRK